MIKLAGHSEWANKKHRKQKQDKKKAKIFGKLSRKIISAARRSGGDPEKNTELKNIIERAHDHDMPKDNIERAIKKGTGDLPGVEYEDYVYEGYGPGGVAVIVEVTTDNKNRSISQIRKIFEDHGGNVGERGCVSYLFEQKGYLTVSVGQISEMELFDLVVEAGAEDLQKNEDIFEIFTDVEAFATVKKALENEGIEPEVANIVQIPNTTVPVEAKQGEKVIKMLDELDDHKDVQNVYSNFDMDTETLEQVEAMSA